METKDNIPVLAFASRESWETWLSEHYDDSKGLWLKIAKKGSGVSTVSYAEAVETALAYGWIDSQKAAYDEKYFLQKFTPRGSKSVWSKTNRDKATELIATGRMKPSGMRQVEFAKANGQWEKAYEPQSQMRIPDDFQDEMEKNKEARDFFSTLTGSNRYAILYRIQDAKRPETRKERIKKFIEMLSRKERL